MKEFNTQYHCTACDGEFDTKGDTAIVTRCPYCGDTEHLEVTALQSADCEIEHFEGENACLTPEQEEMALYERSVEAVGAAAIGNIAVHSMALLIGKLMEIESSFGVVTDDKYDNLINDLNDARARVAISLNQLDALYGENSEYEYERLQDLRDVVENNESEIDMILAGCTENPEG